MSEIICANNKVINYGWYDMCDINKYIVLTILTITISIQIVGGDVPKDAIVYDNINVGHKVLIGIPGFTQVLIYHKVEGIDTFYVGDQVFVEIDLVPPLDEKEFRENNISLQSIEIL